MSLRVMIAGGGTGGHLFPGVAVAEEVMARDSEAALEFVGTERGIEARVVPELGYPLRLIKISGLKTVGLWGALRGLFRIPGAIWQSRRLIKTFRPDVVVGVGGYASGPVVLAARLAGVRTAILEQNSIPGMTNKILGKIAARVFLSFAQSKRFFPAKKILLSGNPIRRQILEALASEGAGAARAERGVRVFVFGGSQGAVALNELMTGAAEILAERKIDISIVHQTGEKDLEACRERYAAAGVDADCRAFITDMASEYRAADIVVARAGATTIAELGVVGRPAILVPYPHAADNHQELNAAEMAEAGAAVMARQAETSAESLANTLEELASDEERRARMGSAMKALGRPEAAATIVDWMSDPKR